MLGKGAKRKLDDDEEELEDKTLADGGLSYTLQRQTVFNISLMKLYSHRPLTEPTLERRVLVNNLLRRIQEELKQEGGPRPLFFPPAPPAANLVDEGFGEAQPAFGALPTAPPLAPHSPTPPDSCLTPASLLEDHAPLFGASPALHGPLRPTPPLVVKDSFSSALDEIEIENPSTTSSPGPGPHLLPKACGQREGAPIALLESHPPVSAEAESRPLDSLPPHGLDMTSSSSSGFLTDLALDDILFADIDTSMYDFDPCTSASGGSSSKTTPVVTADDLLKTLSPYTGGAPTVSSNPPFKLDLTELDHIMEVLVGS